MLPLAAVVGIACIWKQNRGVRGVFRVLFWASLVMVALKFNQLANSTGARPNHALQSTPSDALVSQQVGIDIFGHAWPSLSC